MMEDDRKELIDFAQKLPLHGIGGYFTVMDLNLKYVTVNTHTVGLIGYHSLDQISNTSYYDMPCKASESADIFCKEDKKVIVKNEPLKILSYQCFEKETWKIFIGEKFPIRNRDNKPIGIASHFVDVTSLRLIDLGKYLRKIDSKYYPKFKRIQFSYVFEKNYPDFNLSDRQTECLFFLVRGKTAKSIAKILGLSERTIETHLNEIKNKLGCDSKEQIIEKAINDGYINFLPESLIVKL